MLKKIVYISTSFSFEICDSIFCMLANYAVECNKTLTVSLSHLQLNVRNKSAAGECYIRTEICLEGHYLKP